jgi:adenosylmethionine-8-amino-7-oxononanoate aminotransferase
VESNTIRLEQADKRFLWHPFTQQQAWEAEPQLIIERAKGCYLFDSKGRPYLDGVSSLWVNVHGHNHPALNAALQAQLQKVAHTTFLGLTHPPAIELAQRLATVTPGQLTRVFYSDTGAAAVEIALKMALQYWQQCPDPQPQKQRFFSLANAYHGDTVGAMSVGQIDLYRQAYAALLFSPVHADPGIPCSCPLSCTRHGVPCIHEVERIIAAHHRELAAMIVEPLVQGAAGIRVYPAGYTRALWELAKQYHLLFIVDEVATGFGKTGRLFACEHEGIEPDIMALGKGITGGYLPLAATLTTEEIYRAFLGPERTFYHGHTYTGNPLCCAVALANLALFEQEHTLDRLQSRIDQLGQGLRQLATLPGVVATRQCGIMAGIELQTSPEQPHPERPVLQEARRRGILLRPLGNVLVVMPPLVISEQEMTFLLNTLSIILADRNGV